jgi:hypothetical protein
MDDGVADILETCLDRLAAGASVEECLAAYPAQRGALEAPLHAAARLMRLPRAVMPSHTRAALEAQMLARAAARRTAPPARQPWWWFDPSAILAGALRALGYGGPLSAPWLRMATMAVALVLALLLGASAYAAARAVVSVFAPAPTAIPTAIPTATPAPRTFSIEGIVERIDQEAWIVGGAVIAIDVQTTIDGTPALGAVAHVSGVVREDGARLARSMRLDPTPTPPLPAPTVAPTPFVFPTITPSPAPSPVVAPPSGPGDNSNGGNGGDKGQDKQCQGQQKGRDEKKCDPKPKDNGKQDDKKKDDGRKPKKKD